MLSGWIVAAVASTAVPGATPTAAPPAAVASPSPDPCGGPERLLATADRPTVGFSTCAVAPGTAVLELGYQNQTNGTPLRGSVQSQLPQNVLRLGVASRLEFDVLGPNYERTRSYGVGADAIASGVADSGLGFKIELPPAGRWGIAFDGLYTGPNGSKSLTSGYGIVTVNLDASYSLTAATSLGTTIALSAAGGYAADGSHARYGSFEPSFVLAQQLPHRYQLYAEYAFVSKLAPDLRGRAFADAGVQKLLGDRTEIDVEYGHAFTGVPALRFSYVGAGIVVQLR